LAEPLSEAELAEYRRRAASYAEIVSAAALLLYAPIPVGLADRLEAVETGLDAIESVLKGFQAHIEALEHKLDNDAAGGK
jgi:hypothetical protein